MTLVEVLEDRPERATTLITSRASVKAWSKQGQLVSAGNPVQ